MKALIDPLGRIAQVSQTSFEVHPSFTWLDCADDVTPQTHVHLNGVISRIPNKTQAELDAEKDAAALELKRTKDAFAACLEELFAFVKNPALHATVVSLKQAVIAKYRAKL